MADFLVVVLVGTARAYPGEPDKAGTLNISGAISAAAHPPAAGIVFPLPVGASPMAARSNSVLWDGSRWSSAYFDILGTWD